MSRSLALISALALVVAVGCSRSAALAPAVQATLPDSGAESVAESAAGSIMAKVAGNERLTTLAKALDQAGLAETLSGPEPYTLLAPTDKAFDALPDSAKQALARTETLRTVLAHHVLVGQIAEIELVTAGSVDTYAGVPLQVALVVVAAAETCCGFDQALLINDTEIKWTNLEASNGKIYVTDKVIWLPELPQP